ncbi:MAG: Tat pathway signal sequence domain protein [Azospirillaceae bacterium]
MGGRFAAMALGAALLAAGPAAMAQDEDAADGADAATGDAGGTLSIELNTLEDREDACRAYFVVENGTDIAFTEIRLDVYIFDNDGGIFRRLLLDPGEIAPAKTRVMLFDATGTDCAGIGRFLLDGVLSCADAEGSRQDCDSLVSLSSRLDTPFVD